MRTYLSRNLSVDIGISPSFSFQSLPELGIEEPVICFWEDEQVSFILSLDEQPALSSHEEHWQLISTSIQKEFGQLDISEQGEYESESGIPISFRLFDAGADAAPMIYHLISNGKISYWVIGSLLFCSDEKAVNDITTALLETAELK